MKFVPGNYYKTRTGRKALFIGETVNCPPRSRLVFEVDEGCEYCALRGYYNSGWYNYDIPNELDILSEWENEPKKIERISTDLLDKLTFGNIDDVICDRINKLIDVVNKLQEKIK